MVSLSRWWGFRLRLSARLSLTVAANANTTALRCIDIPSATSIFAGAAASPQTPPLLPLALSRQPAPAPLARLPGGPVAPLVVADHLRRVTQLRRAAQALQPQPQQHPQPAADLLGRHRRIFPPAAPPPARPRSPSST